MRESKAVAIAISPRLRAFVVNLFPAGFSHGIIERTSLLLLLVSASTANGQVIRNQLPLVTKTSAQADRLYSRILQDINSKETEIAKQNIQRLRVLHANRLIAIADRHQMEATLLADQLESISTVTSEIRHQSRPGRLNAFSLWRSILRGELTSSKLLELGDSFWLKGEIKAAQQCWRLASLAATITEKPPLDVATNTESHVSNLDVRKRQIVSYILTGNFRLAQKSLGRLKRTDPDSVGKVAGHEGVIYEILSRLAESLEYADRDSFLLREDRLPFESVRYDLVAQDWSVPIHRNSTTNQAIEPLVWNEVLILQDAHGVRALNFKTGQPAWSIGPEDQGYIFETTTASEANTDISMVCNGGVLDGETWYGRTGADGFVENMQRAPPQQSRISALDLKAEGRLKWTGTTSDLSLNNQFQPRIFSGAPVVHGQYIYVPMRTTTPENQLQIACLNKENGSEIWLSDIAASLLIPAKDQGLYDKITLEGNTLYWLVDGVAVACLNAEKGQLLWVSAVQPLDAVVKQRAIGSHDLTISEDSLLSTTVNGIASFNKFTGKINWEQHLQNPPRSLLGVNDGLLFASDPGIYAVDVDSGEIVWRHDQKKSSRVTQSGVLSGKSIFYPDQAQLITLDAYSGRVLQQDKFPNGKESQIIGVGILPTKLMIQNSKSLQAYRVLFNSE